MASQVILIADSSEDFCRGLSDLLTPCAQVVTCTSGWDALHLAEHLRPQVLVLDLMLPGLDGVSMLEALSLSQCRPAVIATTCLITDYILRTAEALRIDYLMVKPCDIRATAARIREHLSPQALSSSTPEGLQTRISEILLLLGISVKLNGYRYLQEALFRMVLQPDQSITKELYPAVAQSLGVTAAQVERSIRGAIQSAWKHRKEEVWQLYFTGLPVRPTNAVFISRLADGLRSTAGSSPGHVLCRSLPPLQKLP